MIKTLITCLLCFCATQAWAGSIEIESGKMTFFHKTNQAEFIQHVYLKRDAFELRCDKLIAYYKDNQLDHAEAFGNIRLKQDKITGSSDKAILNQAEGKLTLIGNAILQQQGNRVQGETIIHFIDQEKTIVQPKPGGRTRMVIESDDSSPALVPGGEKTGE